jgi:hypothetical protein
MYVNISTHTEHFTLQSYITWRIMLALNSGSKQNIIQEHENKHRNSMYYKIEDLSLLH